MKCFDCPVKCGADRALGLGACKAPEQFVVAHADLHFWEEPCISGQTGTGAIFFGGCNLNCVYCQNSLISHTGRGQKVSFEQLKNLILNLIEQKACSISFVTPSHYTTQLKEFLTELKPFLKVPVVYNSSGYDDVESLKKLNGLIDAYLPDFKYGDANLAKTYGAREDYPVVAQKAIRQMFVQQPVTEFDDDGIIKKGVIVRHLVLPNAIENTKKVLKMLANIDKNAYVSLMSQYFPAGRAENFKDLSRKITQEEYDQAIEYFFELGLENGFMQELSSATDSFVPKFNLL